MSTFCFFTESDILDTQTDLQAYGPVKNAEATQYRVTSLHTSLSRVLNPKFPNPKAFAVCKGFVRFQQNSFNADLVNLVLQPTNVDFKGLPVKYIIYRGILKLSLVANGVFIKPGAYSGDADGYLLNKNYNRDQSFYHYFLANPLCGANNNLETLGLAFNPNNADVNFKREDADAIGSIFFQTTDCNPVEVTPGFYLGDFDKNGFGIEVIVAGMHDEPSLAIARSKTGNNHTFTVTDHVLDINGIADPNQVIFKKEEVLCYIDPCAFFASLITAGPIFSPIYNFKVFDGSNTGADLSFPPAIIYTDPNQAPPYTYYGKAAFISYKWDLSSASDTNFREMYRMIKNFFNRNKIYLDIRNENGTSLNFYNEYPGQVLDFEFNYQKGIDAAAPAYEHSDYQNNGWPVKVFTYIATDNTNPLKKMFDSLPAGFDKEFFVSRLSLSITLGTEVYAQNVTQRFVFASHAGMYYKDNIETKDRNNERFNFFPGRHRLFPAVENNNPVPSIIPLSLTIPAGIGLVSAGVPQLTLLPAYIKIFNNKQNRPTAAGTATINTNNEFDNAFEIKAYEKYVKWRPEPGAFKTSYWLTGREKFVQKTTHSLVSESSMVETGVALEQPTDPAVGRIIFYMMPVAVVKQDLEANYLKRETSKVMNVSKETSFFKAFQNEVTTVTGRQKKLILNWYKQPVDFLEYEMALGFEPNSPETIQAIAMSIREFEKAINIIDADNTLKKNYHPVMIQAQRDGFLDENSTIAKMKLYYTGMDAGRLSILKPLKTENGAADLVVTGRKNIYATAKAVELETGANLMELYRDFLVYYSSQDPVLKQQEKDVFEAVLNLIQLYTTERPSNWRRNVPSFVSIYQRIRNYISAGVGKPDAVFPDYTRNFQPRVYTYPFKIIFDAGAVNINSPAGETGASKFMGKFYETGPLEISSSHMEFRNFKRQTNPATPLFPAKPTYADFPPQEAEDSPNYNHFNLHNFNMYLKANIANPPVNPSDFKTRLLYSDADRRNNVLRNTKVYFEAFDFRADGNAIRNEGLLDKFLKDLTLEEASKLGYNAVDQISITLYREHFKNSISGGAFVPLPPKFSFYVYEEVAGSGNQWVEKDPTGGVKPEVFKMASTLIHEFGHAISSIEDAVENWVWDNFEPFFFYTKKPNSPGEPIDGVLRVPDYMNLPAALANSTILQTCINTHFNFKYGYGHLKGNASGNAACSIGEDFKDWFRTKYREPTKVTVRGLVNPPPAQPAPDNTNLYTEVNTKYCKYNLDRP